MDKPRPFKLSIKAFRFPKLSHFIVVFLLCSLTFRPNLSTVRGDNQIRRANVPFWAPGTPFPSYAIFWFGKVDPTSVYADVRLIYDSTKLNINVHIIDHWLRYDTSPSAADLTQWDSVSIYLDMAGNNGSTPSLSAYRLDAQLNWYESRNNYQAGYRGNGSNWVTDPIPFATTSSWRGDGGPNDSLDDKGWEVNYDIPYSSLGLPGPLPSGTIWGLAVVVHNRDDSNGPALPDTLWPEWMQPSSPSTWGQMRFGIPGFQKPSAVPSNTVMIKNGFNGALVPDAAVGGGFNCGVENGPNFWDGWGSANYAGESQINIQNQWDIADWPCFSKYYVTYPLNSIPKNGVIISATLTMYLGGGSWGGTTPPDSYIQVLSISDDWNESAITWNNAPLANENITGTWVHPKTTDYWPTYTWNVSRAVAEAFAAGQPLRIALYSADGDYHTGKYFSSTDWDPPSDRPNLRVLWGLACDPSNPACNFTKSYLPMLLK